VDRGPVVFSRIADTVFLAVADSGGRFIKPYLQRLARLADSARGRAGSLDRTSIEQRPVRLILDCLFVRVGPNLAQRIAVSVSVLVFGSGSILFIVRAGGHNWWFAFPCVAMLAYGFIFHIGFFNIDPSGFVGRWRTGSR
jgi:hypothetical protein